MWWSSRLAGIGAAACALLGWGVLLGGVGCGQEGRALFQIEAPPGELSPLADTRRDSIVLSDELASRPVGTPVRASTGPTGADSIGELAVGRYDLRMAVTGGGQLLGLARTPSVTITPLVDQVIVLHLRKPIAYFGSSRVLGAAGTPPSTLMALDTTLPVTVPLTVPTPDGAQGGRATATLSTRDGRYLFAGIGSSLYVIDTASQATLHKIPVEKIAGATSAPTVRAFAVSPDDKLLAVVSDQGVGLVSIPSLASGAVTSLPELKLASAQKASFSPKGDVVSFLTGPDWESVDCSSRRASAVHSIAVAAPGMLGPSQPAPGSSTDLAYTRDGTLLIASPCDMGVRALGSTGAVILPGERIYEIVASGDRVYGVQGAFTKLKVPVDPDDPIVKNAVLPFGVISSWDRQSGTHTTPFPIPTNRLSLSKTDEGTPILQVRLTPNSLVASSLAASPDGSRLAFASRIRYDIVNARFQELTDGKSTLFYCTLDVQEDVYRLSVVDAASGLVGYTTVKGTNDLKCTTQCFDCLGFGGCSPSGGPQDCTIHEGYVPAGVSVLLGDQ